MLALLAAVVLAPQDAPRVFRAVFEDRTRMVLATDGHGLWFAYNPWTCALHKVWLGDVDYRGKVYDFSQDNSRAKGRTLSSAPNEILALPDEGPATGWDAFQVRRADGWVFEGDGASLTSPPVDLSPWSDAYVAFDERSAKGRFRVELLEGDTVKQWFESATSVEGDAPWQWNYKHLVPGLGTVRLRFVQELASHRKSLRAVRVFGDQPHWHRADRRAAVRFSGYADTLEEGLRLGFSFRDGEDQRLGVLILRSTRSGWAEEYRADGLLQVRLGTTAPGVTRRVTGGVVERGGGSDWLRFRDAATVTMEVTR